MCVCVGTYALSSMFGCSDNRKHGHVGICEDGGEAPGKTRENMIIATVMMMMMMATAMMVMMMMMASWRT